MSNNSPKWKNPADVMKLRSVKRRTLTRRKTIHDPTDLSAVLNSTVSERSTVLVSKRKNPFGCTVENKRRNIELTDAEKDEPRQLFNALDDVSNESKKDPKIIKHPSNYQVQDLKTSINEADVGRSPSQATYHQDLPVDWSVKVKMRIVSEASLAWCTQLKMVDEANAVTQHVQGGQQWYGEDKRAAFHSCCLHWIHPNIPWMRPFPRILPEQKISNVSIVGCHQEASQALHRDWTESFTSVFHLLRSRKCPYFYVCTHQFSVLFRTDGINQHTNINACITPTTRGLREALKAEGISFQMPNLEGRKLEVSPERGGVQAQGREEDLQLADQEGDDGVTQDAGVSADSTEPTSHCDEDEDENLIDNDEGASVWLESLGLDKKNFPSLDPNKVKIQREGFRRVDNRPESLVYVEGADVQAVFNFLLNCRSCTASSGPQAGIPPTIIAPVAFKGATLRPNKLKHSVAKQTDNAGTIRKGHVIEMSGPILPHHVLNIAHLLREIQAEDFTLTFNTHGPTSPLNLRDTLSVSGPSKDMETSGLHPLAHQTLCGPDILIDNRVYKEVRSSRKGFQYEL